MLPPWSCRPWGLTNWVRRSWPACCLFVVPASVTSTRPSWLIVPSTAPFGLALDADVQRPAGALQAPLLQVQLAVADLRAQPDRDAGRGHVAGGVDGAGL